MLDTALFSCYNPSQENSESTRPARVLAALTSMKHPIGFHPSYPKVIITPNSTAKEESKVTPVDAVAFVTLTDLSESIPYEDKAKENLPE